MSGIKTLYLFSLSLSRKPARDVNKILFGSMKKTSEKFLSRKAVYSEITSW